MPIRKNIFKVVSLNIANYGLRLKCLNARLLILLYAQFM